MRKIKFRVWDNATQKMETCISVANLLGETVVSYLNTPDDEQPEQFDLELMMSIGRVDKNDKDMFEGDIVPVDFSFDKWGPHDFKGYGVINGVIEFCATSNRYIIKFPESTRYDVISTEFGYSRQDQLEVIGNVYENPELIS